MFYVYKKIPVIIEIGQNFATSIYPLGIVLNYHFLYASRDTSLFHVALVVVVYTIVKHRCGAPTMLN